METGTWTWRENSVNLVWMAGAFFWTRRVDENGESYGKIDRVPILLPASITQWLASVERAPRYLFVIGHMRGFPELGRRGVYQRIVVQAERAWCMRRFWTVSQFAAHLQGCRDRQAKARQKRERKRLIAGWDEVPA